MPDTQTDLETINELRAIFARAEGVRPDRIEVTAGYRARVAVLDSSERPVEARAVILSLMWHPPGGGIVEMLDLPTAVAYAVLPSVQRVLDAREAEVREAEQRLAAARTKADAAKVDRDRVARMLEDGVAAARALRAEREATKGSANAR